MWPLQFASWIVILSDSDWIRINLQIKWAPFLRLLLHFHHGERARARAHCRAHPKMCLFHFDFVQKQLIEMLSNSCNSPMWPQAKIKLVIIPPESNTYVTQVDICRELPLPFSFQSSFGGNLGPKNCQAAT